MINTSIVFIFRRVERLTGLKSGIDVESDTQNGLLKLNKDQEPRFKLLAIT